MKDKTNAIDTLIARAKSTMDSGEETAEYGKCSCGSDMVCADCSKSDKNCDC